MMDSALNKTLVEAYWGYSRTNDDNFFWAWDEVYAHTHIIGKKALDLLSDLEAAAENEQERAYLAAGPLEDYVNTVVKTDSVRDAKELVKLYRLRNLLPYVWGERDKFMLMAGLTPFQNS